MDKASILTIIISILAPMTLGFAWILKRFSSIDNRLNTIEKDIAIVKTVLVMKDILPKELAINN